MAGYNGYSMSNNAVAAYDEGKKPLSKIKASDLKASGWLYSAGFAKWLAKQKRRNGHFDNDYMIWEPAEWHHTSKEYNCTNFYDPDDLLNAWIDVPDERRNELFLDYADSQKSKAKTGIPVKGTYVEFTGTRRRPKANEVEFTGTLIGNWIHLHRGGKKKADGNHITWEKIK